MVKLTAAHIDLVSNLLFYFIICIDFREIFEGISLPELLHLHQFNDNESEDCECLFANDFDYSNI